MSQTKMIVITGGPGAGKTAILEMAKKLLLETTVVLPEAASIIFNGGFWRLPSVTAKAAAQRAIYHIQNELETMCIEEKSWQLGLCDRGTLDGLAYWPHAPDTFWKMCNTNLETEMNKYYAVIHLRTPSDKQGYNHENPLRTETAECASVIDNKIAEIWKGHPRYEAIYSSQNFLTKAQMAIERILYYQNDKS